MGGKWTLHRSSLTLDGYAPLSLDRQRIQDEYLLLPIPSFVASIPPVVPSCIIGRNHRPAAAPAIVDVAALAVIPDTLTPPPRDRLLLLPQVASVLQDSRRETRLSVIL